jgi:aminopeptidase N
MWASYHDQWLSEGFAEFSAGLFLRYGVAGNWRPDYLEFWDRLRRRILEKNEFGVAPNDAGPLWMGLRLSSPRTANAYQNVTYPKGAYVLQMLHSMMYSEGDMVFIDTMHDFVETYRDKPSSTEAFKAIAEKHMTKTMDLQGNGRLDWFFNEWVYGTQVPRYHFSYEVTSAGSGKTNLHVNITQSEVSDTFAMLGPIYADFGEGLVRIGQVGIVGNSTRTVDIPLPKQPKKVVFNANKEILER